VHAFRASTALGRLRRFGSVGDTKIDSLPLFLGLLFSEGRAPGIELAVPPLPAPPDLSAFPSGNHFV